MFEEICKSAAHFELINIVFGCAKEVVKSKLHALVLIVDYSHK